MTDAPNPVEYLHRLAGDYDRNLANLSTELLMESGPNRIGLEAIEKTVGIWSQKLRSDVNKVRGADGPEGLKAGRDKFDECTNRFNQEIWTALCALNQIPDPDEQKKSIRTLADACERLRADVCSSFNVPRSTLPGWAGQPENRSAAIVVVDLVGYSERARLLAAAGRLLSESSAIFAVVRLDQIIANHLRDAIGNFPGRPWDDYRVRSTGDGAVIWLPTVKEALLYAHRVHEEAGNFNQAERPSPPYEYRIGIGYGELRFQVYSGALRRFECAGIPLIDAARMEACSPVGGIAVEEEAWLRLASESPPGTDHDVDRIRARGQFQTEIPGKRGEAYRGWLQPATGP